MGKLHCGKLKSPTLSHSQNSQNSVIVLRLFLLERLSLLGLSFEGSVKVDCCNDENSCNNESSYEKELNRSSDVSINELEKLGSPQSTHTHVQGELARIRYILSQPEQHFV